MVPKSSPPLFRPSSTGTERVKSAQSAGSEVRRKQSLQMTETPRICNCPAPLTIYFTALSRKRRICVYLVSTVRPTAAPWRDDHVNIYLFIYPPNPYTTTMQGFRISTHLAFHFHGVAVSTPQRLRLIKAPIHFFPLFEEKKKRRKKVQPPLPTERGALVPGFLLSKSSASLLPEKFEFFFGFFHLPELFSLMRSDRHEGGLYER